jgi:hypothetical protein
MTDDSAPKPSGEKFMGSLLSPLASLPILIAQQGNNAYETGRMVGQITT